MKKLNTTAIASILALILLFATGVIIFMDQMKSAEERGRLRAIEQIKRSGQLKSGSNNSFSDLPSPTSSELSGNLLEASSPDSKFPSKNASVAKKASAETKKPKAEIEKKMDIKAEENPADMEKNLLRAFKPLDQNFKNELSAEGNNSRISKAEDESNAANNRANLERMEQQRQQRLLESKVRNLPMIAKVSEANSNYNFVVIDAGSDKQIQVASRFALRRAGKFICEIELESVDDRKSIANVLGSGAQAAVGDEVIAAPPY